MPLGFLAAEARWCLGMTALDFGGPEIRSCWRRQGRTRRRVALRRGRDRCGWQGGPSCDFPQRFHPSRTMVSHALSQMSADLTKRGRRDLGYRIASPVRTREIRRGRDKTFRSGTPAQRSWSCTGCSSSDLPWRWWYRCRQLGRRLTVRGQHHKRGRRRRRRRSD